MQCFPMKIRDIYASNQKYKQRIEILLNVDDKSYDPRFDIIQSFGTDNENKVTGDAKESLCTAGRCYVFVMK